MEILTNLNVTSENHGQSSLKMEYTVYPLFENCNGCLRKVTTVAVWRSLSQMTLWNGECQKKVQKKKLSLSFPSDHKLDFFLALHSTVLDCISVSLFSGRQITK